MSAGCTLRRLDAPSFVIPQANHAQTHDIIRRALVNRRWVIVKGEPNAFEATYRRVGGASAKIRVAHSDSTVSIGLVDSVGLDYQLSPNSGDAVIHKTYNGWVANLERDIQVLAGVPR